MSDRVETGSRHRPPSPEPLGAGAAAALLASDRAARAEAQTRFDRPLVLEAGAGTGKTTTLIARLLAWCLGEGWDKAAQGLPAGPGLASSAVGRVSSDALSDVDGSSAGGVSPTAGRSSSGAAPAADVTAARVLRRVVALTFTEAAAAEMAGRAARELQAFGRGSAPAEWLGAAPPPPRPPRAG